MKSPMLRWGLGAVAVLLALGVLRLRPWAPKPSDEKQAAARETLAVGFLPVT